MKKYVKVMFGTTSGAKSDFKYKLNEVNESDNWNPTAKKVEILEALIILQKIV